VSMLEFSALCAMMFGLAILPSASAALVVGHSTGAGLRSGLAAAAGIAAGDLVFVFLAIFGLGALAEALGSLFVLIRYAAAAYLVWLGIGLIARSSQPPVRSVAPLSHSVPRAFLAGLALTLGDLKAILFYASLFPVLLDPATLSAADTLLIVVATVLTVGGSKALYAIGAWRIAGSGGRSRLRRPVEALTGGVMIGVGGLLIAKP
jgi:Putative threonine efflux protein